MCDSSSRFPTLEYLLGAILINSEMLPFILTTQKSKDPDMAFAYGLLLSDVLPGFRGRNSRNEVNCHSGT